MYVCVYIFMYIHFILFILCVIEFRFSTLNKQDAQSCSLDILQYNIVLNIATCFVPQGTIIRESQHATVLCCFSLSTQAASKMLYVKIHHIYTTALKRSLHFNHLTLLHPVSYIQKLLIWFYAVLHRFHSLMMVPCGPKRLGIFSVIL